MKIRFKKKYLYFLKCQGDLTPLRPWRLIMKDLFGLSKAFNIVSHEIVKKLFTWSAITDYKLKKTNENNFQHDKM